MNDDIAVLFEGLARLEHRVSLLEQKVNPTPVNNNWKEHIKEEIRKIDTKNDLTLMHNLYQQFEKQTSIHLRAGLTRLREKMSVMGLSPNQCKTLTMLDVIDSNSNSRIIFENIVNENKGDK